VKSTRIQQVVVSVALLAVPGGVLHFIGSGNRTRASVTADAAPADRPTR
jgi:hypothetical protein